jgi:hypothetical protein
MAMGVEMEVAGSLLSCLSCGEEQSGVWNSGSAFVRGGSSERIRPRREWVRGWQPDEA